MPASVRPVYSPIARPRRGLWKPRGSPKIIQSLAPRGLELCAALSPEWQDLVRGRKAIINGAPTIGNTPRGRALLTDGGTQNIAYQLGAANAPGSATGPAGYSIEVLFWCSAIVTSGSLCGFDTSSAGNNGSGSYAALGSQFPNGWEFLQFDSSIASHRVGGSSDNVAGKWYHLVATYDGNTMSFYTNGTLSQATAIGANFASNHSLSDLYFTVGIGAPIFSTNWANGAILLCNYATVSWTAAEVSARYRNPLGFLSWPEDWRHYLVGVAAAASIPIWGYENEPAFPKRRRARGLVQSDDAFPILAVLTPTQQGFAWEPQVPIRRKPRLFRDADDQYPRTVTATPTQFGWNVEPQFAKRPKRKFNIAPSDEEWPMTAALTPGPLAWDSPIYRAIRRKFAPLVGDPDLIIATVNAAGQIVVRINGPSWKRRRSRPSQ